MSVSSTKQECTNRQRHCPAHRACLWFLGGSRKAKSAPADLGRPSARCLAGGDAPARLSRRSRRETPGFPGRRSRTHHQVWTSVSPQSCGSTTKPRLHTAQSGMEPRRSRQSRGSRAARCEDGRKGSGWELH